MAGGSPRGCVLAVSLPDRQLQGPLLPEPAPGLPQGPAHSTSAATTGESTTGLHPFTHSWVSFIRLPLPVPVPGPEPGTQPSSRNAAPLAPAPSSPPPRGARSRFERRRKWRGEKARDQARAAWSCQMPAGGGAWAAGVAVRCLRRRGRGKEPGALPQAPRSAAEALELSVWWDRRSQVHSGRLHPTQGLKQRPRDPPWGLTPQGWGSA